MTFVDEHGKEFEWWMVLPSDIPSFLRRLAQANIPVEKQSQRLEPQGRGRAYTVYQVPSSHIPALKTFLFQDFERAAQEYRQRQITRSFSSYRW